MEQLAHFYTIWSQAYQKAGKKTLLVGVGYRAKADKLKLELVVGYSHPVNFEIPEGITIETPSQTEIVISVWINKRLDKQQLISGR